MGTVGVQFEQKVHFQMNDRFKDSQNEFWLSFIKGLNGGFSDDDGSKIPIISIILL